MAVTGDGVAELARRGLLPVTGHYKGWPLYDGRVLEPFTDAAAAAGATQAGQLHTAAESAAYLRIRRSDLDHLIRAGLLCPADWGHGPSGSRDCFSVPLYRTGDPDGLAARGRHRLAGGARCPGRPPLGADRLTRCPRRKEKEEDPTMAVTDSPWARMHEITITIDEALLCRVTDEHLAVWWHVTQANPADGFADTDPGDLAEKAGREIIRRWLAGVPPELWHHQGRHHSWHELTRLGTWNQHGEFVPHTPASTAISGPGDDAGHEEVPG